MSLYFNPDNERYRTTSEDILYIDKTGLIGELNKVINSEKNCVAISHARRFGKS